MTLIEFFDKVPLENIIGALALKPDRVIFLGADHKRMHRMLPIFRQILRSKGLKTVLTSRTIRDNDISHILSTLQDILKKDDEYVFDFTGGEEGALVALGMVFRRTDHHCAIFQIDCGSRQGILYKMQTGENSSFSVIPYNGTDVSENVFLTIQENILLHGGTLRQEMVSAHTAASYSFTPAVYKSLQRLWQICRTDCTFWNKQVGRLGGSLRQSEEDPDVYTLSSSLHGLDEGFIASLTDGGFLQVKQMGKEKLWYCTFPNPYVRECLSKAGTLLEYKTYMAACQYKGDTPLPPPYTDGGAGVIIDWADSLQKKFPAPRKYGKFPHQDTRTQNEIDGLYMQGVIPLFVSCKNGAVDTDELYKLHTVAGRFGHKYAKRMLVSTVYFDKNDRGYAGDNTAAYLRSRAQDMQIRLIECVHTMSDAEFAKAVRTLDSE